MAAQAATSVAGPDELIRAGFHVNVLFELSVSHAGREYPDWLWQLLDKKLALSGLRRKRVEDMNMDEVSVSYSILLAHAGPSRLACSMGVPSWHLQPQGCSLHVHDRSLNTVVVLIMRRCCIDFLACTVRSLDVAAPAASEAR